MQIQRKSTADDRAAIPDGGGSGFTRREFLGAMAKYSAAALTSPVLAELVAPIEPPGDNSELSVVHKVYSKRVLNGLKVNPIRLNSMLDATIMSISDCPDIASAWRKFIRPEWKVLLKFTQFIGTGMGNHRVMMNAVLSSLERGGLDLSNFCVAGCRYGQYRSELIKPAQGWSARTVSVASSQEQVRKYLEGIDAIINIPSLTDHVQVGVNCAMLNVSMPLIRRPGAYTGDNAHRMIATVCASSGESAPVPPTVLNVVNALQCAYNGGPQVVGAWVRPVRQLWASTDMVAVDRVAGQWIELSRRREGMKSLADDGRAPRYISMAGEMGVGKSSLDRIKIEHFSI